MVDPAAARRRRGFIFGGVGVLVIALVVTIVIVATTARSGGGSGVVTPPPDGLGSDVAITVQGDQIMRGDQPWWFLGYNSFVWSGNCGNSDERMSEEQMDEWFASMRHDGRGAARLFFFDGWDLDRLDHAVEVARENDIYLMITLDDAIGGCGETDKDEAWFQDEDERDTYRDHMVSLLERYRGETTIAWFEYFNEPDVADGALRQFYDEMGEVADEVDPDRLFSTGMVAPYAADGGEGYASVNESPGVDIASLHEYDENETESNHGPEAREFSAGKPVIVGEFGVNASESGDDCRDFAARAEQFRGKVEAYTTVDGYAGALAWAWQPTGGADCVYGNLDVDDASQSVLRDWGMSTS